MLELERKSVLVTGLNARALAVCRTLVRLGARAVVVDSAPVAATNVVARELREMGAMVMEGVDALPKGEFALAISCREGIFNEAIRAAGIELISELEFGFQITRCLVLAVGGTNGRGTTSRLIEQVLMANQRRTTVCGEKRLPVCTAAESSHEMDYLLVNASPSQLENTCFFRPSVAVLTNLAPDDLGCFSSREAYLKACARLFHNQQSFDWAIVQSDALAGLREIGVPLPAKIITFSATDSEADIFLDRGLLISRMPDWPGPLMNLEQCSLHGPHNAENLMAALAVGRVLRLPLDRMVDALQKFEAGPHRCNLVAEINGVRYVDDSAAWNSHALRQALLTVHPGFGSKPNVILIAGGRETGGEYHDLGPILAGRVKQALLLGPSAAKMSAAWRLFTPCAGADSLLEAVSVAANSAAPGDVILFSPACSSVDQSLDDNIQGVAFCAAVNSLDGAARPPAHNGNNDKPENGVE